MRNTRARGATAYGRYMLHRAPLFNVSSVVWVREITLRLTTMTHGAWSVLTENEIQETRFRRKDEGTKAGLRRC